MIPYFWRESNKMEKIEQTFFENLYSGITSTGTLEWIAVITGLLYVIFAARKNQICWFFASISSSLYVYICIDYQLYIESGLQLFYVATAILGWISWRKTAISKDDIHDNTTQNGISDIKLWSLNNHLLNILISGILSFCLGFIFDTYTDQANPYIDAFTTIFSLAATFMVVQKVLENWIYWIVIDIVGIYLYFQRGLQLSSVLYLIFTIIAITGFINWKKMFKAQSS